MKTLTNAATSIPSHASALGRPIDPTFGSNRLALAGSIASGVVFGTLNLIAAEEVFASAFAAGMAVFLAWAIGRELDPDDNSAAAWAMLAAFGYLFLATPSLLFAAGTLLATRLIAGTVGIRLRTVDRIVLVGLGALLGSSLISVATIPALLAGIVINEQRSSRSIILATATGVAGALTYAIRVPEFDLINPSSIALASLGAVLLALLWTVPARRPLSPPDLGLGILDAWRISSARLGAALSLVLAYLLAGDVGIMQSIGITGAAIMGVATAKRRTGRKANDRKD